MTKPMNTFPGPPPLASNHSHIDRFYHAAISANLHPVSKHKYQYQFRT